MKWRPVANRELLGFAIFCLLIIKFCLFGDRWFPGLDWFNLALHEAGHPIVGVLSRRLEVYGGTFGQLAFPMAFAVRFYWQRYTIALAFSLAWIFENLLNIARYMRDARAQLLPLVGGGEHDWFNIFSRWHVLQYDIAIADFVAKVATLGIFLGVIWAVVVWNGNRGAG